ncbi:hypothetical protein [Thiovibrio frasassiensis]|uniref:DUF4145 domain-containing protein n=1 Tax=Thiovibrio frasassiensis TaxID=2984131 RepID=A0A9X4MF82_9BACT|nr:hypothetical protein [Thiovibrio frasassiensis]MDG4474925.1 hypothetical protein [Thiovibrio frasassiensis]
MYIDSKKFDYKEFAYPDADRLIERDKKFAQESYRNWLNESIEAIVERQWEIDDIGAIGQVGDFVKLLKEAEFTYSIGAYTSTIALVGVCAEDLCRFFATSAGHNLDSQSQFNRVNTLLGFGAITQDVADKFHIIRGLRNDCLHFNQGFKQKNQEALNSDALNALNSIKAIYAQIMGAIDYKTIDSSKFSEMVNIIANEAAGTEVGTLGVDEALTRTRNIFASAFGIDISMNNLGRPVYKTSIYVVEEIDAEGEPFELTLKDFAVGAYVIVDINENELTAIREKSITEGDIVAVSLMSVPNKLETTGTWHLWSEIKKLT